MPWAHMYLSHMPWAHVYLSHMPWAHVYLSHVPWAFMYLSCQSRITMDLNTENIVPHLASPIVSLLLHQVLRSTYIQYTVERDNFNFDSTWQLFKDFYPQKHTHMSSTVLCKHIITV